MSKSGTKQHFWQRPLFTISVGNRRFEPSLIPILGFLILLPVLLRLGVWQLDRAEEKRNIISGLEKNAMTEAVSLNQALEEPQSDMRNIYTSGQVISGGTLVVDNQKHNGRLGYEIYSLWQTSEYSTPILVNRGWLPRKDFYQKVPDIPPFTADSLRGTLYFSKGANEMVADNAQWVEYDGVWLVGQFDFQTLAEKVEQMGYDSAPFIIRLKANDKSSFVRQWELIASPPEKHIAYAIQWFAMALALVMLFIILNLKRVKQNESTTS